MILTTSKSNQYDGIMAYAPTYDDGLMIEIRDTRPFSEIAPEFENLDWVEIVALQPTRYNAYRVLKLMSRTGDTVQMKLYRG